MTDNDILNEILSDSRKRVNSRIIQLLDNGQREHLRIALIERTSFLPPDATHSQRAWHLNTSTRSVPECQCGNLLTFIRFTVGYTKYCSPTCATTSDNRRQKALLTIQERYGVTNAGLIEGAKEKRRTTNLKKYGVEFPLQNPTILEKTRGSQVTSNGNWGFKNNEQRARSNEVKFEKYGTTHGNPKSYAHITDIQRSLLGDSALLKKWHITDKLSATEIAEKIGVSRSTVLIAFKTHQIDVQLHHQSSHERKVCRLLQEHNIPYESAVRTIISPYELDIVIPSKRVAIEVNGLWYHSERYGYDKKRHLVKTEKMIQKQYRLIHLYDYEITHKWDVCKSLILSAVGNNNRVYARNLTVHQLSNQQSRAFFSSTHIQGAGLAPVICYGLVDDAEEVVAAMSFGRSRYNKTIPWELLRYSSKHHTSVVGGASRLFTHFIRTFNPASVISYCDRRLFTGQVYHQLGFVNTHVTDPNYWYFDTKFDRLYSRVTFQKHKLAAKLPIFDESKTEWENMVANNYNRVWDCGNSVWVWSSYQHS